MRFGKALRYFVREALLNLGRSLRVSLLSVLTIGISLFLGGTFLLAGRNLRSSVEHWQKDTRLILYLKEGIPAPEVATLAAHVLTAPWVSAVDTVTPEEARTRFQQAFPSMAELLQGGEQDALPASLEIGMKDGTRSSQMNPWIATWRRDPRVAMIDDDREWLRQLQTVVTVVRAAGLLLGGILLGAAIFTIASVIRLTAYLHREEIAVMRLVGATEFFIRGPFYVEGLIQGLLGGGFASAGLFLGYRLLKAKAGASLLPAILAADFLDPLQVAFLIGVGALAGLFGAVVSLRREAL